MSKTQRVNLMMSMRLLILIVLGSDSLFTVKVWAQGGSEEGADAPRVQKENIVERAVASSLERIEDYRADLHVWNQSVRGFRRDHNFAIGSGVSSGSWRLVQFGASSNRFIDSKGTYGRFQYTFHLQIDEGVGYFLGSTFGVTTGDTNEKEGLVKVLRVQIPGALGGIAWNISPALRISCGLNFNLERLEGVVVKSGSTDPAVSVTAQSWGAHFATDLFLRLAWAIRIEAYFTTLRSEKPKNAQNYGANVRIEKKERSIGLGLVYHFL